MWFIKEAASPEFPELDSVVSTERRGSKQVGQGAWAACLEDMTGNASAQVVHRCFCKCPSSDAAQSGEVCVLCNL